MKGHFQTYILGQDATLSPSTSSTTVGAGFLPGGVSFCPPAVASANLTWTLPTGSDMEAAFPDQKVGDSWLYTFVNLDASKTVTIAANTGFSVSGTNGTAANGLVAAGSAVVFEIDKLADNSFDCYRVYSSPASY